MKKLFLLGFLATIATTMVQAQSKNPERIVKVSTDTTHDADTTTVTMLGMASGVKAFQATTKRLSGTAAGIVLLQATINGNDWVNVNTDTLTLTNQVTNTKVWPITSTTYYSYRLWYKTTGTQTSTTSMSSMRRPDE